MKKFYVSSALVMMVVFLSYCHTAKKASSAATPAAVTYESNIKPIILASCAPCHVPSKGGNKEALDNYAESKKDIDDILRRVQLDPATKGFMPMRHPKLSDSTIAVFKAWKDGGLTEK